jgi:hypothetical protein
MFDLFAPSFFAQHTFKEFNWSQLEEPGPWGLVHSSSLKGADFIADPAIE